MKKSSNINDNANIQVKPSAPTPAEPSLPAKTSGWKTRGKTLIACVVVLLLIALLIKLFAGGALPAWVQMGRDGLGAELFIFVLVGFTAQMIDGALGMAYGVSASTFLLSFGVPPAAVSASIHTSEIFTSGVSGLMHLKFKNVNRRLFKTLLLPGIVGAILGAYALSSLEEYNYLLKPAIATYTLILGVVIIRKALTGNTKKKVRRIFPLALFGGFMDSVGGGGWGPIVSSSLIAGGRHPRYTVGSVNLAEFFVALASSLTFITFIGLSHWQIVAGLIIGGVIAAPIAANLSRKLPVKSMMILVGVVVIAVSLRMLYLTLF